MDVLQLLQYTRLQTTVKDSVHPHAHTHISLTYIFQVNVG